MEGKTKIKLEYVEDEEIEIKEEPFFAEEPKKEINEEIEEIERAVDVEMMKAEEKIYILSYMAVGRGSARYKCGICDAVFARLDNVNVHMRIHKKKPYRCDICGLNFDNINNLKAHERWHLGERPYRFDICGDAENCANSLHRHKRSHANEKQYRCDDCKVSFSDSSSLNSHLKTHIGEKLFRCPVCSGEYKSLRKHMKIHIKLISVKSAHMSPYECKICKEKFLESSTLKNHMTRHRKKNHRCSICDAVFSESRILMRHLRNHLDKKKSHICSVCDASFEKSHMLTKHLKTHLDVKSAAKFS